MKKNNSIRSRLPLIVGALVVLGLLGWFGWNQFNETGPGPGFASGNGRIEATEVDVAAKLAGRIDDILVKEGDFVRKGQPLVRMQISTLEAQLAEAEASHQEALHAVAAAKAQIALRQSDVAAAKAVIMQRQAELDAANQRMKRSQSLAGQGATSRQQLDDDRTAVLSAEAAIAAARAQVVAAEAAVQAAEAQHVGAQSRARAAQATVARVKADIEDSELRAPRDGRVQFLVAQAGEVLAPGGKVLNLVDLSDVYMTFFLPEVQAGQVALGSEARIILDAAPHYVIPAEISFVASTAQFTPKTVETESERQKLMFRVRARIPPSLLEQYLEYVKTGLPGITWVKLDPEAEWPEHLTPNIGK
ncbi:MAG TPA: HlyD family efflux transporter periplasmic adaptor subunit [Burkholderiaceae bacterium]|nr:HlyD family efflux transporter periplasmic adaptor subunit [Burkholderiaceae bacterium]